MSRTLSDELNRASGPLSPRGTMKPPLVEVETAIDYAAFRFAAVIDWIEVRVKLPARSQPRHVRDRMPLHWRKPYVNAETDCSSLTAAAFTFRVQDPVGPAQFMRDVQAIVQPGKSPLTEADIEIIGVEIAFDAYSENQDRARLVDMAEWLTMRQARLPQGVGGLRAAPPRDSGTTGGVMTTRSQVRRTLERGWTINAGDANADFARRWYVKEHDTKDGESYASLPVADHRARCEITLRGIRVPFITMRDWRDFRFETLLTPYFSWRTGIQDEVAGDQFRSHLPKEMILIWGVAEGVKRRGRRKTRSATRVDQHLRQQAKNALERLTRRQRRQ